MMHLRMLTAAILVAGVAGPARAQVPVLGDHAVAIEGHNPAMVLAQKVEAVFEAKVTTGRPYSADATTEFLQVLADGNRIARKTTVRVYRDGEGRTRREELGVDGSIVSVSIYDPVAHLSFVLDPARRTAYKSAVHVMYPGVAAATVQKVRTEHHVVERGGGKIALVAPAEAPVVVSTDPVGLKVEAVHAPPPTSVRAGVRTRHPFVPGKFDGESLGEKFVDGIPIEGTRRKMEIPAGAVGNLQPIVVVTEQWVSPDLEVLVMTKHSDPRAGETTYTLSNIVRAEPSPLLFEVPADYTIKESTYMREPAMH